MLLSFVHSSAGEKEAIREMLLLLVDSETHPVLITCSSGAGRSGLVVFLLMSFCGFSIEALAADAETARAKAVLSRESGNNLKLVFCLLMSFFSTPLWRRPSRGTHRTH